MLTAPSRVGSSWRCLHTHMSLVVLWSHQSQPFSDTVLGLASTELIFTARTADTGFQPKIPWLRQAGRMVLLCFSRDMLSLSALMLGCSGLEADGAAWEDSVQSCLDDDEPYTSHIWVWFERAGDFILENRRTIPDIILVYKYEKEGVQIRCNQDLSNGNQWSSPPLEIFNSCLEMVLCFMWACLSSVVGQDDPFNRGHFQHQPLHKAVSIPAKELLF